MPCAVACACLGTASVARAQANPPLPTTEAPVVDSTPSVPAAPPETNTPAPASDTNAPPASEASSASSSASATEIVVQGNKIEALKRASGSGTSIGEREIRNAQPESSSELLRRVPGVQVRQEDPMGLRLNLGVRGLSPIRSRLILMEEDGIPVVVSPYGEPELYYTTAVERVQRLDVIKGSDVLEYGPQTVGAVIELHTWNPTEHPSWYLSDQVGSRGFGEVIGRYSNTTNDIGYVAQVMRKSGDGYRDMGFYATDAFGKMVVPTGSSGTLTLKLGFHDELAHTTFTGLTDLLYRQDPRQDTLTPNDYLAIRRYEVGLSHEQQLGQRTALHSALFGYEMSLGQRLQDFDRGPKPNIYQRIVDPSALFLRNTSSLRDRAYYVAGASSELEHHITSGTIEQRITVGARAMADVARRKLSMGASPTADSGQPLTDNTTQIIGLSGWAQDQIAFGHTLLITPAVRIEHSSSFETLHLTDNDPPTPPQAADLHASAQSNGLTPGVGVILGSPKLNAFSDVYRGYSAPQLSQAITPDGQDAHLPAETSVNFEIGARGRLGTWLRAEADGFFIDFGNQLISNNPLSGNTSELIAGGPTHHLGAEATATLRVGKALELPLDIDLGAQYAYVRARFAGGTYDGHTVPYSPANTATLTLDAALPVGLSAQASLSYIGDQYSDEQNSVIPGPTGLDGIIDAYTVIDVGARYRYAPSGVSFGVSVKSLLNDVYISDRLPNGIFTAGFRQIFATFAWSPDSG
ncbi:MAG TPA: TonB-dependent receptor [Polyangiaceae bacterium]|jgi:Fe(3+) dicitrate transport protein|nr:TonB-dependent receptor [Polyangiaceae bacterium]